MGQVAAPPEVHAHGRNAVDTGIERQDRINRQFMRSEEKQPQARTFAAGLDFIRRNHCEDSWFLQIETFDPHEPFFSQRKYQDLYRELMGDRSAPLFDWPSYARVTESPALVAQCRGQYASLVSMCDARLGDVLDEMDRLEMWEDTLLMVWTDHGFLLGEHDWWAKLRMPWYEELAHTPLFVWDPRTGQRGERRESLVQPAIDLGPTLLDFFGLQATPDMLGRNLREAIATDTAVREGAIFGLHGGHVNFTDGRYVYMRAPVNDANEPLFDYTLMPTHMKEMFSVEELGSAELTPPFSFTKHCPQLRIRRPSSEPDPHAPGNKRRVGVSTFETMLFDLGGDPQQEQPVENPDLEARLAALMVELMRTCDAPEEQYQRLGL
jgi:arylsulfatase A-like enzyme